LSIKVIAEIGSNWEGNAELGKLHIKKSKESGASHVKFQMWKAEDLYDKNHPHWNKIKKAELSEGTAKELKDYADRLGITWFCSVFNPEAVDFLESINTPIYKIASRTSSLNDKFALETIEKVGQTKKKTFVSTGEGADKSKISNLFEKDKIEFTYCVSKYPTQDSDIDWKEILKYNFFSDHTEGILIPTVYGVLKNSCKNKDIFIEKHVRLEQNKGPDASFAIQYEELAELVNNLKRIEKITL